MMIIAWLIQIMMVLGLSPLLIGIIKKIKAVFQNRKGSTVFQSYVDLWKLFHKDEVVSEDTSCIFMLSPYLMFGLTVFLAINLPIFVQATSAFPYVGDFLLVAYTLALGTFFLALSGLDVGSPFGGFGSSREMTLASLAEGGLLFSFLVPALIAKTTILQFIVGSMGSVSPLLIIPVILSAVSFILCLLVENARFPFDNPATHLELTMVHEAMILEYSGKRLALVEWSAYNKLFIFSALAGLIFMPFGLSFGAGIFGAVISVAVLLIKILLIGVFVAVLESTIAKFRYFRSMNLLFFAFGLDVLAVVLTILMK
jgi:formate hydrogenlyase subunit 4